jgi:TPR repeat protein
MSTITTAARSDVLDTTPLLLAKKKMKVSSLFAFLVTIAAVAFADGQLFGKNGGEGKGAFEEGQKKAKALSSKLARRKLSLEKGDPLPEKLQKDVDEIVALFTKSAGAGYAEAQYALGGMYNLGYMVEKNDDMAVKLFTAAADQGNLEALSNLATMYKDGVGVVQDISKAMELFEKAFAGGQET